MPALQLFCACGVGKGKLGCWEEAQLLSPCAGWLIVVEGVGDDPGAPGMDDSGAGIWWGEHLAGAKAQPVRLSNPERLVYSPHTYGPIRTVTYRPFAAASRTNERTACRSAAASMAPPLSMPTPPVMPLAVLLGAASAAKWRPYSLAPSVNGLTVGSASTNDLMFLLPPHLTATGYW